MLFQRQWCKHMTYHKLQARTFFCFFCFVNRCSSDQRNQRHQRGLKKTPPHIWSPLASTYPSTCRHNQLCWGQQACFYLPAPKIHLTRVGVGIWVNGEKTSFALMWSVGQRVGVCVEEVDSFPVLRWPLKRWCMCLCMCVLCAHACVDR